MGTTCLRCSACSTTPSSVSYLRMKKIVIALFIVALTCVAPAFGAELQNMGKDCWYKCNSKQGPCSWCGTAGMCCKKGLNDKSNGCDGTFGGSTQHECVLECSDTVPCPLDKIWNLPAYCSNGRCRPKLRSGPVIGPDVPIKRLPSLSSYPPDHHQ